MKRLIPGVSEWASSDVQCWVSNEVSIRYLCGLCGCEPALSALTLLLKGCESATWYSGACWTPPWLQHTCWSYRGSRRGAGGSGGLRHHHQRYQSPAFQRRGDAGPFWGHVWHNGSPLTLSVTVSYPNWANERRPACRGPCLTCTVLPLWFTWTRLKLRVLLLFESRRSPGPKGFNLWSRRGSIVCMFESLLPTRKTVLFGHTIHPVHWKYSHLSFSNQWHQFQWTIVYSAAAEQKGLCALCSQLNVYIWNKSISY